MFGSAEAPPAAPDVGPCVVPRTLLCGVLVAAACVAVAAGAVDVETGIVGTGVEVEVLT